MHLTNKTGKTHNKNIKHIHSTHLGVSYTVTINKYNDSSRNHHIKGILNIPKIIAIQRKIQIFYIISVVITKIRFNSIRSSQQIARWNCLMTLHLKKEKSKKQKKELSKLFPFLFNRHAKNSDTDLLPLIIKTLHHLLERVTNSRSGILSQLDERFKNYKRIKNWMRRFK
jgi:hypothetical protein